MEFLCLGCEHYLGWISIPPCTLHMACVVSTLHIADKSREAAVLLSLCLWLMMQTLSKHRTLFDYSRQVLLSNISKKHKKKYM